MGIMILQYIFNLIRVLSFREGISQCEKQALPEMFRNLLVTPTRWGLGARLQPKTVPDLFSSYSTGPGRGPPVGNWNAKKMRSTVYYFGATAVLTLGLSYAAVPLYRMFCQATSYGGTTSAQHDGSKVADMKARRERQFRIKFNADTGASMRWNFKPQQIEIKAGGA